MIKYIPAVMLLLSAPSYADRALTDAERTAVATAVADQMRDPESTQFRWLPVNDAADPLYCGLYNAKNAFGGYVGFRPFVVILPRGSQTAVEVKQIDTARPRYGQPGLAEATCAHNHYDLRAATSSVASQN